MAAREILTTLRSVSSSSLDALLFRPYLNLFGTVVKERFVVLGNARTGSNYLLDGLASSRAIKTYHEIFAAHTRTIGKDYDGVFQTLFQKEHRDVQLVGFKLFYNHLTSEEWERFRQQADFKVIHLTRRNRLRTLISLDIAFKTGQWTRSSRLLGKASEDRRVSLDPGKVIGRLERIRDDEQLARERLSHRPILEVVYEEMVAGPLETFDRISTFLGVDDIDPSRIHIRRQNPERLERLITNYEQVRSALKGTEFEEYLQE